MDTARPPIYPGLAGKTVFITGGGSGIGAAFTQTFALQGARVAFVDIADEASRTLMGQIQKETGTAPLFIPCDVRDIAALQGAIEKVRLAFGDIGVLINNAGNDDRHTLYQVTRSFCDDGFSLSSHYM